MIISNLPCSHYRYEQLTIFIKNVIQFVDDPIRETFQININKTLSELSEYSLSDIKNQ